MLNVRDGLMRDDEFCKERSSSSGSPGLSRQNQVMFIRRALLSKEDSSQLSITDPCDFATQPFLLYFIPLNTHMKEEGIWYLINEYGKHCV